MACLPQGFKDPRVQTLLQLGFDHRLSTRLGAPTQCGHLGTCMVPRLQTCQGRLLERDMESCQLEKCGQETPRCQQVMMNKFLCKVNNSREHI